MQMNPNLIEQRKQVKYQLQVILSQLAMTTKDANGKMTKIEAVDKTLREIFGQKQIMSRLLRCKNGGQTLHVINGIGANTLFKMTSSKTLMSILVELTDAKDRIEHLEKLIDKSERKGKRVPKEAFKELSYLKKLYKEGTKAMRKHLGIRKIDSGDYKKRYSSLKNFVKDDYGYFDGFGMSFDEDDEEGEDYFGARFPGAGSQFVTGNPFNNAMNFDSDDDDDDPDGDDDDERDERLDAIEKNIGDITTILKSVLGKKNGDECVRSNTPVQKTAPEYHEPFQRPQQVYHPGNESTTPDLIHCMRSIENTMSQVNRSVTMVADNLSDFSVTMNNMDENYRNLVEFLMSDDDDDNEPLDPTAGEEELAPAGPVGRVYVDDRAARAGEMSQEQLMTEINAASTAGDDITVNVNVIREEGNVQ